MIVSETGVPEEYILLCLFYITLHTRILFFRTKLLKCSGCQYVYYCGKMCQREGWSVHKLECRNLRRVAPRIVPDAARFLARLIRTLQKGGDTFKSYYTEGSFRMFKDLMSRKNTHPHTQH